MENIEAARIRVIFTLCWEARYQSEADPHALKLPHLEFAIMDHRERRIIKSVIQHEARFLTPPLEPIESFTIEYHWYTVNLNRFLRYILFASNRLCSGISYLI